MKLLLQMEEDKNENVELQTKLNKKENDIKMLQLKLKELTKGQSALSITEK